MTAASEQTASGARGLADRLRDLREREFSRLTQSDLGQAIGDPGNPLSPATISAWENPHSGRQVPQQRLASYARLFCTPRSFEGGSPHLIPDGDLTPGERARMAELEAELVGLREAADRPVPQAAPAAESMWHFPDQTRITLVCSRLPAERQPPRANPDDLQYVRYSDLADLDTLIDIYGAIRAYNPPNTRVVITAAQDLTQKDVANHLVLIGGLAWETVNPFLGPIFPFPIKAGDPAEDGAIVVDDPVGGKQEFRYRLANGKLVEDVGFFARGENPAAPRRTLTVIGGITTRGVHGAARCFIDYELRERNERYLNPRFPPGSTYCVVMRVPVINRDPVTPDLSKPENRLYEWDNSGARAE